MKDALIVTALSILPRNRGARAMGWFARTGASKLLTRAFVRAYGVNLDEASGSLADYSTLEALFTRTLRKGARPIDEADGALVSPVDGRVAAAGPTVNGKIEVAPGRDLDVADLVGQPFEGERDVVVLYLSPKDYHRVHVPREGSANGWRYVPGTLWPVFPAAVRKVDGLFAKNERLVVHCETSEGELAVVLVGAFGVGRITTPLCELVTNCGQQGGEHAFDEPLPLTRGAELGTFHLGSTVVLVAPPGRWRLTIAVGEPVRMGRSIAHAIGSET